MKRLFGWMMAGVGAAASSWGLYCLMAGVSTTTHLQVTNDVSVTALTGGLIGLTLLTLGLIWVRD